MTSIAAIATSLLTRQQLALFLAGFLSWLSVASKSGKLSLVLAKIPGRAHYVLIVAVPTLVSGWTAYEAGSPIAVAILAGVIAGGLGIIASRLATAGVPFDAIGTVLTTVEGEGLGGAAFAKALVTELLENPAFEAFLAKVLSSTKAPASTVVNISGPVTTPDRTTKPDVVGAVGALKAK